MSLFAETLSVEISPFAKVKTNGCAKKKKKINQKLHSRAGNKEANWEGVSWEKSMED